MNILISAFAFCGPDYSGERHPGSEYIIAWNFVTGLARETSGRVTVLVGCSDGTFSLGEFKNLRVNELPPNVRVVAVASSAKTMRWFKVFKFLGNWIWPLVLRSWNKDAYKVAKHSHSADKFDVVHQYGPGGFKNPGLLYRLEGTKSVWGPMYGWHFYPLQHAFSQSFCIGVKCCVWNLLNWASSLDPSLSRAARGYDSLVYGTPEAKKRFKTRFNCDGVIVPEQGVDGAISVPTRNREPMRITWVGSLDYRKNISLFLRVVERLSLEGVQISIVGSGPHERLIKKSYQCLLERPQVDFVGALPRDDLLNLFSETDCIVFTTLAEGNTSVLFEALKYGVIPITPDTHGFSNTVRVVGGELIDMNQSVSAVEKGFVDAIMKLKSCDLGTRRSVIGEKAAALSVSEIIASHLRNYEVLK
jgi:glycosyltransferase involved in cell wall biosynthesis